VPLGVLCSEAFFNANGREWVANVREWFGERIEGGKGDFDADERGCASLTQIDADVVSQRKCPQIRFASANGREWLGKRFHTKKEIPTQMSADALRFRRSTRMRDLNANVRKFASLPQMAANAKEAVRH
jgi:hypothetical protein